jgi:hypothetical protein
VPLPTDPVYIIGTERSGSNLLRLLLHAHSGIVVPHPPHLLHFLAPVEASYGDLSDRAHRRCLVEDAVRLVQAHIYAWDVPLDVDALTDEARPPDLMGVMGAIYDAARRASGKRRWGNKSTFMVHHVDRAVARDPEARFIWLVRDPRDVAVSSKTSVFSTCHPFNTGLLWAEQQGEALRHRDKLGEGQVHLLRYEDLLADHEGSLRKLCTFLGEDYEPAMLRFFEGEEARKSARLSESWKNTGRPIQHDNRGKWAKALTAEEVTMVECSTAPLMQTLGYEVSTPEATLRAFSPPLARIAFLERMYRARVELRSLRSDENHQQRRERDRTVERIRRDRTRGRP